MNDQGSRNGERSINDKIGDVLREMHPRWKEGDSIVTENTRMFVKAKAKAPDIVVRHHRGVPVIIETEIDPAGEVEEDASGRFGNTLSKDGSKIEQVIALCLPKELEYVFQSKLHEKIKLARFKFCLYSAIDKKEDSKGYCRWPDKGWIKGDIGDLVTFIEHTALTKKKIEEGMEVLEEGVEQAANMLQEACETDDPAALTDIAEELHQEEGDQTRKMAMAIIANAFSFHMAISKNEGVTKIPKLRNKRGLLTQEAVMKEWQRIRDEINYWPIFDIALKILQHIDNATAEKIINLLASKAGELDTIGVTDQQHLSGRMLQGLIADRKLLATFYTRPESAALLAELTVSRLEKVDWSKKEDIIGLRIADFACGTGALLNASYGAMMTRHRIRGGV